MSLVKSTLMKSLGEVFQNKPPKNQAEMEALKKGTQFSQGLANSIVDYLDTATFTVSIETGTLSGGAYTGSGSGTLKQVTTKEAAIVTFNQGMVEMFENMTGSFLDDFITLLKSIISGTVISMKTNGVSIKGNSSTTVTNYSGTGTLTDTASTAQKAILKTKLESLNLRITDGKVETLEQQNARLGMAAADYFLTSICDCVHNTFTSCIVTSNYITASGTGGIVT